MLMAAGLLAVVIVLGAVVLATRSGRQERSDDDRAPTEAEPSAAPTAPAPAPLPGSSAPPRAATPSIGATSPPPPSADDTAPDASGEEVPIWARRPTIQTVPFPEGARVNEPMAPVNLPAWMTDPNGIVPGGSVNEQSAGGAAGGGDGG